MKNLFLQVCCMLFAIQSIAQVDTIFYNTDWKPTSKDSAHFYRLLPLEKIGELYAVKDYFINGNLQMEGFSTSPEKDFFHGTAIWYYPNQQKKQEAEFNNRKKDGKFITYHQDGTINTSCIYKNNKPFEGDFLQDIYSVQGQRMGYYNFRPEVERYKDGELIYEYAHYQNSKQIAFEVFYNNKTTLSKYYQKDGTKIGEITYDQGFQNGKHVNFYRKENELTITGISTIGNYKDKREHGEFIYFNKKGELKAKGIYKNRRKFSGSFYEAIDYQIYQLIHFTEGIQMGEVVIYNKEEEVIAKGEIKNGEWWSGHFFIDDSHLSRKQIASYKNGKKEGKQTHFYDSQGTNMKFYNHILNDKLEGESAYFDKDGKQLSLGIYKENEPWEGTFYDAKRRTLSTYEDGMSHGEFIKLNYLGEVCYQANYHYGQLTGTVTTINFLDGKTHKCDFRNGAPIGGSYFDREELTLQFFSNYELIEEHHFKHDYNQETYEENKDGANKTLPYLIEKFENDQIIETIKTDKNGNRHHLIYKNEKPYQGALLDNYGELTTFEKGKKHGEFKHKNILKDLYYSGQYLQDSLDGKIVFYENNNQDSVYCFYKNGKPIDGEAWTIFNKTNYKDGKKHGVELSEVNLGLANKISRTYKNGVLDGPIIYYKDDVEIKRGQYKNNQPYKGDIIEKGERLVFPMNYYSKKTESVYHIATYKNGKKEGTQHTYNQKSNKLLKSDEYKKNKLITKTVFETSPDSKTEWKGFYKKEKPYNGAFVTRGNKLIQIDFLEKGNLEKVISIHKNGQDTLVLKNQKPFDGTQIRLVGDDLFQNTYQKGMLTKVLFSEFEVNYFPNGFETIKSCKDCMIHKVEFSNQNNTSGMITFGENRTEDFIRFSNGKIVEMNFKEKIYDGKTKNWEAENFKPTLKLLSRNGDLAIRVESDFQLNLERLYFNLINLEEKLFDNGKIFYYLKNDKNLLASLNIVNGKHFHGIEIEQDRDGLFYLEKMVNGEKVLDLEGITLEKVLEVCKENQ